MALRINNIKVDGLKVSVKEILSNIKHYLEEDITKAVKTILDENIERTYCFKSSNEPVLKIVYSKEVKGNVYIRRSTIYGYLENGNIYNKILDTRISQFTEREIIKYKSYLVNNVMNIFKTKAKEVDELLNNNETTQALDYLFSEQSIKAGLDYAKQFGDITKLVSAISTLTDAEMPVLFNNVPDWRIEDAEKFGIPQDSTPIIKEWVLLYFNIDNFKIYPL